MQRFQGYIDTICVYVSAGSVQIVGYIVQGRVKCGAVVSELRTEGVPHTFLTPSAKHCMQQSVGTILYNFYYLNSVTNTTIHVYSANVALFLALDFASLWLTVRLIWLIFKRRRAKHLWFTRR